MRSYIRTVIFVPGLIITTLICGILAILTLAITKNPNWGHYWARLWGLLQLKMTGTKVSVEGKEHVNLREAYIYMANHQSWFDIFVLLAYIPGQFRWLAKEELYRIPVLGYAMKVIGYIPIDRSNRAKAFESLSKAAEQIKGGVSVMIFPEGTRSSDGILQPFKKGGFVLAIQSGKPIMPVSISGSHKVLKKGCWMVNPGVIKVTIHQPITTEGLSIKERDRLMEDVEIAIKSGLSFEERGEEEAVKKTGATTAN